MATAFTDLLFKCLHDIQCWDDTKSLNTVVCYVLNVAVNQESVLKEADVVGAENDLTLHWQVQTCIPHFCN